MNREYLSTMLNDYVKSVYNLQNARTQRQYNEGLDETNFNLKLFLDALEEEINKMVVKKIEEIT